LFVENPVRGLFSITTTKNNFGHFHHIKVHILSPPDALSKKAVNERTNTNHEVGFVCRRSKVRRVFLYVRKLEVRPYCILTADNLTLCPRRMKVRFISYLALEIAHKYHG
jgi:hypothetical protein